MTSVGSSSPQRVSCRVMVQRPIIVQPCAAKAWRFSITAVLWLVYTKAGTAIIHGEKGQQVWTGFCDEEALSEGVYKTYTEENLRYSQNAPLDMYP